MAEYALI